MKQNKGDWNWLWIYIAVFAGIPVVFTLIRCGFSPSPQQCTAGLAIDLFAETAHIALLALSVFSGYYAGKRTQKNWIGWLTFIVVFIASAMFSVFVGIPIGGGDGGSDDYSWR